MKQIKSQNDFLNHSKIANKIFWNLSNVMILSSIMFIYCIINVIKKKKNPNHGGLYIDSSDWIKNKKNK